TAVCLHERQGRSHRAVYRVPPRRAQRVDRGSAGGSLRAGKLIGARTAMSASSFKSFGPRTRLCLSSKSQAPSSREAPSFKIQNAPSPYWSLVLEVSLELGTWNLELSVNRAPSPHPSPPRAETPRL